MAFDAHSIPTPAGQVITFPGEYNPPVDPGRLRFDATPPANVIRLREPWTPTRDYTPTSILLGAIVGTLTPRQFHKLTDELRRRWQAGDEMAMAAFNLGVDGAYHS